MRKPTFGSDLTEGPESAGEGFVLTAPAEFNDEGLSFRLAHDGSDRVFRGGSWSNDASDADVALRLWLDPSYRSNNLGLRLVREDT